jgi:predicted SAM-dependent methyltransferase
MLGWHELRLARLPGLRSMLGSRAKMRALQWLAPGLKRSIYHGKRHYCPICNSSVRAFMRFGPLQAEWCPVCTAMRRHRMLWVFLQQRTNLFDGRPKRMLHVAPEVALEPTLKRIPKLDYVTADLNDPHVMDLQDITNLTYEDESFDVIACSHVLEHVPDDRAAMREMFRVLRPGGWAVIMVPYAADTVTDEDSSITDPAERETRFGQFDHVRYYGSDIVDRLEEAGLHVDVVTAHELLDADELGRVQVDAGETVFYSTRPATSSE